MAKYIFNGLMFPVFDLPESANLLDKFPSLAQWREFHVPSRHNINKVIRYIVAMYDKNGLIVMEQNGSRRKTAALELAGWKRQSDTGEFRSDVIDIIDGKNEAINNMIVRYCKLQRSNKYSVIVGMSEMFYSILRKTVSGETVSPAELGKFEQLEKTLDERMVQFLNNDASKDLREDAFAIIELEKLDLNPEEIAVKLKEGKPAVRVTPYGPNYSPDKIRMIIEEEEA